MKQLFSVLAVFGAVILLSATGLVITGNPVKTKSTWYLYDVPFSEDKIMTGANIQELVSGLGYTQEQAVEELKRLSKEGVTCYNSDGSPSKEQLTKGFVADRSGAVHVDRCGYERTENRYVLRESYCGKNEYAAIRSIYCSLCQDGICVKN